MILIDTSVWADHFRLSDDRLQNLLEHRSVVMHPFVLGELACGNLPKRDRTIDYLETLPVTAIAPDREVRFLLESRRLWGTGLGWVDMHLLVSAAIGGFKLWTADRAMAAAARITGVEFKANPPSA